MAMVSMAGHIFVAMWHTVWQATSLANTECATEGPSKYRWRGQMEFSENVAYMYGQNFKIFVPNVQIAAGIGTK
jgi:hypothetical protein